MTRRVDWIRTCASMCGSPQLCAIALITAACSGCGGGGAVAKPLDTRLGCDEGVCINVEGYWGAPDGGMIPVTISGINTDGTSTGFIVTGTRTTAWVDVNGNGEVDPG
ncbi:MAG: hypothetical protein KF841_10700 [Phycisphaerae bacterium]|nr:hypothetical protein [Phycisphaerae bacterium]